MAIAPTKACSLCGEVKASDAFNRVVSRGREYLQGRCRACCTEYHRDWRGENREKSRTYHREYAVRRRSTPRGKAEQRGSNLNHLYGLSLAGYDAIYREQGGVCAICACVPHGRPLFVDHDHDTGAIRGLLCSRCNSMIGMARDDGDRLIAGASYLRRHRDARAPSTISKES